MSDQEIYDRFIDWLKNSWHDLPVTDELVSFVRTMYTPDSAALLTGMAFFGHTDIEEYARKRQMDPAELREKLDALAKRGVVFRFIRDGVARYRLNNMFFVAMRSAFWPGRTDELTKSAAPMANRYFADFFDQWKDVHHKGLRTVPINGTIEDTRRVLPYDDVVKIVNDRRYWSVSHCACKHRRNVDPDTPDCQYPTEVCLHFDRLGRYIVENGMGREITREETLEILRQAAEAGLVHGASTWQDQVDTICNCDKCCCMWFQTYHVLKHSGSLDPSNYRAQFSHERCKGCGLCVKRCPMEAVRLEESPEADNKTGKVAVLNSEVCIGCGVCAYKCPGEAIVLEQREEIQEPPKDAREFMKCWFEDREAARAEK